MSHKASWRLRVTATVVVGLGLTWLMINGMAGPRSPDAEVVSMGRQLFTHEWQPNDPLAAAGDGLGPVFNAKSCAECHFQGGVGGAGPRKHNVLSFEVDPTPTNPRGVIPGVVHAAAVGPELLETRENVRRLFPIVKEGERVIGSCRVITRDFDPVHFASVNTPALFGAGLIDRLSDSAITRNMRLRRLQIIARELRGEFHSPPVGRARRLPDGRIGKFGWKGQFATLEEFVATACAVEVGLTNPLRAQDLPHKHTAHANAKLDLDERQFQALVAYVETLPKPRQVSPTDPHALSRAERGRKLFTSIGCADCHAPDIDGVTGIYSDFLLHRVAPRVTGGGYGRIERDLPLPSEHPKPDEWQTPPLWGVADTAPYFHDGNSPTLGAAIVRHAGDAEGIKQNYLALDAADQQAVIAFLKTLRAPPENPLLAEHTPGN